MKRNFALQVSGETFELEHTVMHRILNIQSYRCCTCGKKFSEQGLFELHLRIHSNDDPQYQDGYLSMLKLRTALQVLQKVKMSSKEDSKCMGEERNTESRLARCSELADDDKSEQVSGSQRQQRKSADNIGAENITRSEGSLSKGGGRGGFPNEDGKTLAEKIDHSPLLNIKHATTQQIQRIESYLCRVCGKSFGERSCFELHIRLHLDENPPHQDGYQSMLKLRAALLKLQMMIASRKKVSEQEKDGSFLPRRATVDRSLLWQVCKYCGECFASDDGLSDHMDEHVATQIPFSKYPVSDCPIKDLHPCNQCPKKFFSRRTLQRHMHVHKEPYVCQVCGKQFHHSSFSNFKHHMKLHTGDFPYACEKCGKTFRRDGELACHKAVHSDQRPFQCSVCGHTFKSVWRLRHHLKGHRATRSLCEVCGKSFTRPETLKYHYRIHTGEKPCECPLCGKRFASLKLLRVHKTSHGEPLYECHVCHKRITTKFGLRCHMRIHTGEEPFSCDICGKKIQEKTHLSHPHQDPCLEGLWLLQITADVTAHKEWA